MGSLRLSPEVGLMGDNDGLEVKVGDLSEVTKGPLHQQMKTNVGRIRVMNNCY